MLLYVTDGLEPAERAALVAHLASGCPQCAGALAEAQATVAHLPRVEDQVRPPASAKQKLMSRVATATSSSSTSSSSRRASRWPGMAIAACIGAILAGGAVWMTLQNQLTPIRAKDLQLVSMTSPTQPKATGRVMWDHDHGKWHVTVFDLSPPAAGQTYELWFITPEGKKVPGGTFDVDSSGRGSLIAAVPPGIGPIALAAVTNEPIGGVTQPTGNIHLKGEVK
jgi:anti-sigma-K factor RskA